MKLTRAVTGTITQDWLRCFPELGTYRRLGLGRRVGPLLQGIVLDRESTGEVYRPKSHVHSLATASPTLSLTLSHELRTVRTNAPDDVSVARHGARHLEAAERLARQSLLPLSGPLRVDQVLGAYERYMTEIPAFYSPSFHEDMVALLTWVGDSERARTTLEHAVGVVAQKGPRVVERIGGVEAWKAGVWERVGDRDRVRACVAKECKVHGLESLPYSDLA